MLGHASLETTQIYSHLFPKSDDMVRAAVDRAMRSLRSVHDGTQFRRIWGPVGVRVEDPDL